MTITVHHGDCLDVLRTLSDASVDAVCTDPPYGLEFMGREWDGADGFRRSLNPADAGRDNPFGRASRTSPEYRAGHLFQQWCEVWATECLRVLKPGGHMLAFGGTRTWHRLACAVEDAGFEVRDSLAWLHGQGFPKSLNVSRALDTQRCRCEMGELDHDGDVRRVRDGVPAVPQPRRAGDVPDLLTPMQRASSRSAVGDVRGSGAEGAWPLRPALRGGQPSLEGRGDAQAPEGQLHRSPVRPLPAGVPGDGPDGRLHHGAPTGDGSVDGSLPAAVGGGQPQGPQPVEQRPVESGAVPEQRRPQAWGGWPVCGRCSQPVIPDGLGTAAKPGFEPIVVARKPLTGTVAANVLAHGTGSLNIDGCRIEGDVPSVPQPRFSNGRDDLPGHASGRNGDMSHAAGRWPANVVLDESQAEALDAMSGVLTSGANPTRRGADENRTAYGDFDGQHGLEHRRMDTGGASRFFYVAREDRPCSDESLDFHPSTATTGTTTPGASEEPAGAWSSAAPVERLTSTRFRYVAKADTTERVRINGHAHPTVKPLELMRWLVRLVTPPGGTVLEPFAGSGTTVEACILEGLSCIAIEREADYLPLIQQRIDRRRDPVAAVRATGDDAGLFDLLDEEPA